jgi:isoprenylcysteine carboxyl methyltransferase (ICMT) family protein YpbQ
MNEKIVGIIFAVLVIILGFIVSIEHEKTFTEQCDEKFGRNNWKLIKITGNLSHEFYKENPFFIGQAWECEKK